MSTQSNLFIQFLGLLKVKYTHSHACRIYNEHPYKNTLFGISRMLWEYGVSNMGLRLNDKKEIYSLEVPFIAQLNQDFVIVKQLDKKEIRYLERGKEITVTTEEFFNAWSGVVLVAEADENSIEPGYVTNRKKERVEQWEKYLLLSLVIIIAVQSYFSFKSYTSLTTNLSLLLNLTGCYTGYLLILKQLHIQSDSADKLCSLLHQGDCNNILESPAAKFMGVIGWSEIGLSYFLSNLWVILFAPSLMSYLVWINICALPYSFWSIWYQKVKAKSWCMLCLVVQALLWGIFLANLLGQQITFPVVTLTDILQVGCIYLLPLAVIRILLPLFSDARKTENLTQEINSLRMHKDVFGALLKQNSYCPAEDVSRIIFGNPESAVQITILTNPHCDPCGRMHARVKKLLESSGNQFGVQYIFTSFNEDVESSALALIAIYLNAAPEIRAKAFDEWFERAKYYREEFFRKYPYNKESPEVQEEYQKHTTWKKKYALSFTPMVFVNGYEMPQGYKIEDINYFPDLKTDHSPLQQNHEETVE